jgi:hypothetical protein
MLPALPLSALPSEVARVGCTFCVALPARSSRPSAKMCAGANVPSAFFNALHGSQQRQDQRLCLIN